MMYDSVLFLHIMNVTFCGKKLNLTFGAVMVLYLFQLWNLNPPKQYKNK